MYGVGLADDANSALWQLLKDAVPALEAVELRQPGGDLRAHWLDPALAMSQTCGGPLVASLSGRVAVVGTPHFEADGCDGPDYSSLLVTRPAVRQTSTGLSYFRAGRAAINSVDSLSGYTALLAAAAAELDRVGAADENSRQFFRELVTTGSHQESVRCVAEGRADVAAIDCVTFALLRAHRPELLNGVAVFGRTPPLPGLPIIAASGSPHVAPLRAAWQGLFPGSEHSRPAREALLLKGFTPADETMLEGYQRRVSSAVAAAATVAGRAQGDALRPAAERSASDAAFIRKALDFARGVLSRGDLEGIAHPEWGGHSWQRFGDSGGWGRLILPGGLERLEAFRGQDLPTVCFLGTKRSGLERSVEEECWVVDAELIEKMTGRDEVLLYASLPVDERPGSDWGNIVMLQPGEASHCPAAGGFGSADWDAVHRQEAVDKVSPKYYERVRLHRGELAAELLWRAEGGAAGCTLNLHYTTHLDYTGAETTRTQTRWLAGHCL